MTHLTYLATSLLLVFFTATFYSSASAGGMCDSVLAANPNATSGEYVVKTVETNTQIEVYCEMGLNGGGYTFIKPQFMSSIRNSELQTMLTDRTSVLVVPRVCNGTPIYYALEQLPQFADIPLKIALNDWSGYTKPINVDVIGPPYLFVGFIPPNITSQAGEALGVQSNGQNLTYSNSSETTDSYIAFFANFQEVTPAPVSPGITEFRDTPLCDSLENSVKNIPSGRTMPPEYFIFMDLNFGGLAGCHYDTNPASRADTCFISFALGFK